MLLTDLLPPERIRIPLTARDKEGVLHELSELVAAAAGVPEEEPALRHAVLERERVLSTGIGGGVALPHGKSGVVDRLWLAAGVPAEPLEFDALDGEPVRLVFFLVGPPWGGGLHVKVLSRIARLVRRDRVREKLAGSATAEEFVRHLKEVEEA